MKEIFKIDTTHLPCETLVDVVCVYHKYCKYIIFMCQYVSFHIRAKEEDNSRRKHCSGVLQLYEQRFFEMSSAYFACSKCSKLINLIKSSQELGQMRTI